MDAAKEDENVEVKIDRINSVISSLIRDIESSHGESDRVSVISPFESFCEDFAEYHDPFAEISFASNCVPQEFLNKFQENLTEIDRLQMTIEDHLGNSTRQPESLFEILLTKEQLHSLHGDTGLLLQNNASNALLKVGKNFFIIESACRPDKVFYLSDSISSTKSFNCNFQKQSHIANNPINCSHIDSNLIKIQAELEIKYLTISKKEEKIRTLEEEFGYKIQKLESITNEYYVKLEEIKRKEEICSANESFGGNDKTQSFYRYKDNKKILQSLDVLEKIVMEKYRKKENDVSILQDFSGIFEKNRKDFNENLQMMKFANRDAYVLSYVKEQHRLQDLKIQEIQEYEKYLQETWVESFGNEKVVTALERVSRKNYQISQSLKKERELIDEKAFRLQKLIETTKVENKRLEFHRKRILNERQFLIKQQSDLEAALIKIQSMR